VNRSTCVDAPATAMALRLPPPEKGASPVLKHSPDRNQNACATHRLQAPNNRAAEEMKTQRGILTPVRPHQHLPRLGTMQNDEFWNYHTWLKLAWAWVRGCAVEERETIMAADTIVVCRGRLGPVTPFSVHLTSLQRKTCLSHQLHCAATVRGCILPSCRVAAECRSQEGVRV
jgi:hypothetical protein